MRAVEAVTIRQDLDPWLSLSGLAGYSGLSVRTLRGLLRHPGHPLPHYRVGAPGFPGKRGAKVLVRRSEFDRWMGRWRQEGAPTLRDLDRILEAAVATAKAQRGGGNGGFVGKRGARCRERWARAARPAVSVAPGLRNDRRTGWDGQFAETRIGRRGLADVRDLDTLVETARRRHLP